MTMAVAVSLISSLGSVFFQTLSMLSLYTESALGVTVVAQDRGGDVCHGELLEVLLVSAPTAVQLIRLVSVRQERLNLREGLDEPSNRVTLHRLKRDLDAVVVPVAPTSADLHPFELEGLVGRDVCRSARGTR